MKKNFQQKNKAFTLVETLIAISIFTVSILSLLVVLSQSISRTNYAKTKVVASFLAEEGVEYIRNMRDTYVLYSATTQAGWDAFNSKLTTNSCEAADGCYFNADNLIYSDTTQPMIDIIFSACSSATCPNGILLYDPATGKYGFSGVSSGYSRKITVNIISANETEVFSTVYWTQGSGTYNIVFSESLFNWVE